MISVIDIGARGGLNFDLNKFSSSLTVYAFELDAKECERLNSGQEYESKHRVEYFPIALGKSASSSPLFLTKDAACSSIYKPIDSLADKFSELDCIRPLTEMRIKLHTLESWAQERGIEHIDYMKLDTQGSELDILRGAGKLLNHISLIEIEVEFTEIYAGQPLFADVDAFMRANGFALWNLNNFVHYSLANRTELTSTTSSFHNSKRFELQNPGGQLYWGHALYVNSKFLDTASGEHFELRIEELTELCRNLNLIDLEMEVSEIKNRK
jgi:FkbM family methyltransferase